MKNKVFFVLIPFFLSLLALILMKDEDENTHNPYDEKAIYSTILAETYPTLLNSSVDPDVKTLRALKTAGDLRALFGDLSQFHIAEIGGGDGIQCEILSELCGFASYTIIDRPENFHKTTNNIHYVDLNRVEKKTFDLVIANTPFLGYPSEIQETLLHSVLESAPHGYLQVDKIHYSLKKHPLNAAALIKVVRGQGREGSIMREHPRIDRYLMRWSPPQNGKTASKANHDLPAGTAVTYTLSGGRLGDNLIQYLHARWIAYKYNIPLRITPFPGSDFFHLDGAVEEPDHLLPSRTFSTESELLSICSPSLLVVPYFPECAFEFGAFNPFPFMVNWDDPEFKTILHACLSPKESVETLALPEDCLTVAVHVRRGVKKKGGADSRSARIAFPLKFPPDSFYIEEMKRVEEIFSDQPIYFFIFTDDPEPEKILKMYKKSFPSKHIQLACYPADNRPDQFSDFYSMAKFDCILLCQSGFSTVASKLGDYKFISTPIHATSKIKGKKRKKVVVDELELKFRPDSLKRE